MSVNKLQPPCKKCKNFNGGHCLTYIIEVLGDTRMQTSDGCFEQSELKILKLSDAQKRVLLIALDHDDDLTPGVMQSSTEWVLSSKGLIEFIGPGYGYKECWGLTKKGKLVALELKELGHD